MTRPLPRAFCLALTLALVALPISAQKATAVPKLDLNKLTGSWYEIARLPTKSQKKCLSDDTVLYALGDKPAAFQAGTFCTVKGNDQANMNLTGKQGKTGDGKLKTSYLLLLHRPYWVLANDPAFNWALVGTPDHKSLWILSRQTTLPPVLYAQIQQTASAQGFPTAKLLLVPHPKNRTTLASPSANPNQIETPTPTPTKTPTP